MRRRILRTLVIVMLLGVLTNVLVAAWFVWTAVTHVGVAETRIKTIGGHDVCWQEGEAVGATCIAWIALFSPDPRFPGSDLAGPPAWSGAHSDEIRLRMAKPPGEQDLSSWRIDLAYGWPMRSLRGSVTRFTEPPAHEEHEFGALKPIVFTMSGRVMSEARTVPLAPMMPGALVNTLVYGAAWWLMLFLPGAGRRWRRRQHGACLACGYDRRGIGVDAACPECGATGHGCNRFSDDVGATDTPVASRWRSWLLWDHADERSMTL